MSEIARTGKWNPGGGRWLEIVPLAYVSTYARPSLTSTPTITLLAGKDWTRIYCSPETLQYRVSREITANGPLYTVEIKGFSPDDSPTKADALDRLFTEERFLVRFCDNSGLIRVAGSPVEYLSLGDEFSTDVTVGGSRGYSLDLKGTLTQRPRMPKSHTLDLLAFLGQPWLIEPEAGALLLAQLVNGQIVLAQDWEDDPIHYADPNWTYYPTAQKENSTAIINMPGVLYNYYVNYVCSKLDLIYADGNVTSLVVKLNGPGGAANAGNKLADKLLAAPFPTLGYIDYGMAASAHYMIGAACDQLYASRPNDKAGSIGTYIQYQNWKKALEKAGVVSTDLYAKQSTEKNEESRRAEAGDFSLLQKMADEEATRFIDYVKARRRTSMLPNKTLLKAACSMPLMHWKSASLTV